MTPVRIECESEIDRVEVYARGAIVVRRVALPKDLPREVVDVAIAGVTAQAEPGSIRATVDGGRTVVALGARLVLPEPKSTQGSLSERLRTLELEMERIDADRAHVSARKALFAGAVLDPNLSRRTRPVDARARIRDGLAVSDLIATQIAQLDARSRELELAHERTTRELDAARLAAAQGNTEQLEGEARARYEFMVRLAAAAEGSVNRLEIAYVVAAARWWPAYTARFTESATRVAMALDAFVAQCTGEDWRAAHLALSTADLVHDARLPELPSLRLSRAQIPARKGYRPPPAGLDALFEQYDRAVAARRSMTGTGGTEATGRREYAARRAPKPAPQRIAANTVAFGAAADAAPMGIVTATLDEGMLYEQAPPAQAALAPPSAAPMAPGFSGPASEMAVAKRSGFLGAAGTMARSAAQGAPALREFAHAEPSAIEPADAWLDFDALMLVDVSVDVVVASRGRLVRAPSARPRDVYARAIESVTPALPALDPRETRGRFDHRYDALARADVPSDGLTHRVSVASADANARVNFRTVPRESPEVYREAEVQNPFDSPLLAGPVEVFIDGALTTTSQITSVDRGGNIWLGLGVEERLRVARNARAEEASAGLLGGSTAIEHAITIDVVSTLGRAVTVTVIDRVPVTTEKDVDISTSFARPPSEAYDQVDRGSPVAGGRLWKADVPAGGKSRIEFGYRITLPAKSEIVGGNRRE